MATTKHIATLDGQTFTRSSKSRVYTHCVVAKPSYEAAVRAASAKGWLEAHRSNYHYYVGKLAKGAQNEWDQSYVDKARERLAGIADEQAYVDAEVAKSLARVEKARTEGYYDTWAECGWCGRLDLAQKLAATKRNHEYYGDVVILEAVQL